MTHTKFVLTAAIVLFAILNFSSCDDDESSSEYSKFHGWWLHEFQLEGEGAPSMAYAYWFHDDVVEGEYLLIDHLESGVFSKHAVGKWYMNNIICVDMPYTVKGDTIFIDNSKDNFLVFKNGKLVKNGNGREYTKQ